MSKRIVALYAKHSNNSSDENAFKLRSQKATTEVLSFENGNEFLNYLKIFSGKGKIDELKVHSHGFQNGIIGNEFDMGIYLQEYKTTAGNKSIATYDIAGAIRTGEVKFSTNSFITLYGCNNSLFAQELSRYLRLHGRKDISVTGADNSVYEKNGVARVDRLTTGISNGNRGKFHTYKNGILVRSVDFISYK